MLAAQAPDLHEALQEVAEQGWSHVVVDEGRTIVNHINAPPADLGTAATTADEYGCTELMMMPDASGDPVAPTQDRSAP